MKIKVAQCWDDGVYTDIRLIGILREYGAKATFNLNPGNAPEETRGTSWGRFCEPPQHWGYRGFDAGKTERPEDAFVRKIGFNSSSHYQFAHFINMNDDYPKIVDKAAAEWERLDRDFSIPYYPHVSIGWDNSPRIKESMRVRENTPENFEAALREAKAYVDSHPDHHPLITVNSWNEWTETSYLQPDDLYGYGYLEAVKKVFVDEK